MYEAFANNIDEVIKYYVKDKDLKDLLEQIAVQSSASNQQGISPFTPAPNLKVPTSTAA